MQANFVEILKGILIARCNKFLYILSFSKDRISLNSGALYIVYNIITYA
jgi:hypothetical protein